MYHKVIYKRAGVDSKGNDREFTETFLVENKELCSEAELIVLEYWNNECEVISVQQTKIYEFANVKENDEQDIYLSTIEDCFVDDNGEEKFTKYVVGIFATSVEEATKKVGEYMKQGLNQMRLTSIKKTKIIDLLK